MNDAWREFAMLVIDGAWKSDSGLLDVNEILEEAQNLGLIRLDVSTPGEPKLIYTIAGVDDAQSG